MKKRLVSVLPFVSALCLAGCSTDKASIGIIGGADGPTAIFVASNINWLRVCGLIGLIVVAILVARSIWHKKK